MKKPCLGVCLGGVFRARVGLVWGCGGVCGVGVGCGVVWGVSEDLDAALFLIGIACLVVSALGVA